MPCFKFRVGRKRILNTSRKVVTQCTKLSGVSAGHAHFESREKKNSPKMKTITASTTPEHNIVFFPFKTVYFLRCSAKPYGKLMLSISQVCILRLSPDLVLAVAIFGAMFNRSQIVLPLENAFC